MTHTDCGSEGTDTEKTETDAEMGPTTLTEKQRRIVAYLRTHVAERTYFKSGRIGQELGLSAKEVGANIATIRAVSGDIGLDIEKLGYSSSTTWMVSRP